MKEGWGGLLVLLNVFSHVGCASWCSRGPCRALVAEIFRWATARAGKIGGPAWTGVGLHAFHAHPVRIAMGCRERYRSGGYVKPRASWGPQQTASQTAFGHCRYFLTIYFMTKTTQKCANFVDALLVLRFLIIFCSSFIFLQSNDYIVQI